MSEVVPDKGFGLFTHRGAGAKGATGLSASRTAPADVVDVEPIVRSVEPLSSTTHSDSSPSSFAGATGGLAGIKIKKRGEESALAPSTEASGSEPTSLAGRLGGFVSKKTPAAATSGGFSFKGSPSKKSEPVKDEAATPASRSVFSFGAKAKDKNGAAKDRPAGAAKRPKKSAGLASGGKAPHLDVLVELEGGREVFWRVGPASMEELAVGDVSKAVSFTKQDLRIPTDTTLSSNAAQDLVLGEVGSSVRVINATKQQKAVFATTTERLSTLKNVSLAPGLLVIEQLVEAEREGDEHLLCGLVLTDESAGRSLIVLHHFAPAGMVSSVQVTANADNVNFVIAQFAATNKLDLAQTKALLFKNEDLLKAAGALRYYPKDAAYFGVAVSTLLISAAAGAVAVSAGLCGYAGIKYVEKDKAQGVLRAVNADKARLHKELDAKLIGAITSYSKSQSVDVAQVMGRAEALWVPGAKVTVEASLPKQAYVLTMPLSRAGNVSGNPSVLGQLAEADLSPLLQGKDIEGCVKSSPSISGGLNAIQITVTCEGRTADGAAR